MRHVRMSFLLLGIATLGATGMAACSSGSEDPTDNGEDLGFDAGDEDTGIADVLPDRQRRDAGTDAKSSDATSESDAHDAGDADAHRDADASDGDAGKKDAELPETGTPCSPANTVQTQKCGYCGTQDRVCMDLADSGAPVWQEWGFCRGEVDGGCNPGDLRDIGCGNCGTMNQKCSNACQWPDPTAGVCKDAGPCAPGEYDFKEGLSCDSGGRLRTCDPTCQWGDFESSCIDGPPVFLTISETVGGKVKQKFSLDATHTLPRLATSATCPVADPSTNTVTPYIFVKLVNPTAHDAKVSVWQSDPGTGYIDTVIAVYNTVSPPLDATSRRACVTGTMSLDGCSDTTTDPDGTACKSSWAGLMLHDGSNDHSVTVPANSYLWVYNAAWSLSGTGAFQLNAITHSFAP